MLEKRFITADDVADLLGVHRETVYRWLKQGKLPKACKVGKFLRWDYQELIDFLSAKGGDQEDVPAA